jgi:hypothetical protein
LFGLFVLFAGECRYTTNKKRVQKNGYFCFPAWLFTFFFWWVCFLAENCDKKMKRTRRIMMMKCNKNDENSWQTSVSLISEFGYLGEHDNQLKNGS